jgi:hypothetical protein
MPRIGFVELYLDFLPAFDSVCELVSPSQDSRMHYFITIRFVARLVEIARVLSAPPPGNFQPLDLLYFVVPDLFVMAIIIVVDCILVFEYNFTSLHVRNAFVLLPRL